jgi:hypothetical protein
MRGIPPISNIEGESQPMPTTPMEYIWPGIIAAQAIYAATKLRIPDLLATPALPAAYDFSRFQCIVDVGGGEGALLRDILAATPELRGILFDLPQVVAGAPAVLSGDVAARCQIVGGSFFDSVPEGASAYLMKGVIHDWPDDDAVKILQNIRRVIPPGSTLLIVESLVDSTARPAGLADMLMLAIGGRERTEADFRSLLASTRFSLTGIIATEASSVIECHPV